MKDKTCSYKECRFFHLSGTKITYTPKFTQLKNDKKATNKVAVKNRFEVFNDESEEESAPTLEPKKVFQQDSPKLMNAIN